MSVADPLLITLRCTGAGWNRCEELREQHFPAARNVVPAHVMLFHHLPGEELEQVTSQATEIARSTLVFSPRVSSVRSLGRGVALAIESPELLDVHRKLSTIWDAWLSPQDRARYDPHITIQNKVTGEKARVLLASLATTFRPFGIGALGVDLWHYRSGPWEHAVFLAFGG